MKMTNEPVKQNDDEKRHDNFSITLENTLGTYSDAMTTCKSFQSDVSTAFIRRTFLLSFAVNENYS